MKAGRKNLKREALEHGVEEPEAGHVLMRVVGLRGGNIVEAENAAGDFTLCLLPAKFQKTIWIKTGTIVVVDEADREKAMEAGNKVTGTISRVLLENQVRALRKSVSWWPDSFKDERLVFEDAKEGETGSSKIEDLGEEDAYIGSEDENGLPPLEANSNRQHAMSTYECAESDDSSDDEPQLRMQSRDVPRCLFQFEFDLERRILAEAELQGNPHLRDSSTSQANGDANLAEVEDATVVKYLAMGHSKEAVQYALQSFGDDQTKVLDFCPAYYKIRDMGFPSDRVARALAQHNIDEEQAVLALVGG